MLVIRYRELSDSEFVAWKKQYDQASLVFNLRQCLVTHDCSSLRIVRRPFATSFWKLSETTCYLVLLASKTNCKDGLPADGSVTQHRQDGVPEAIETLRDAGLKVCTFRPYV